MQRNENTILRVIFTILLGCAAVFLYYIILSEIQHAGMMEKIRKEMKENADRLKALMEDPSALTGSLQDKFTSVAKSYGGDLGIPTSQEDIDALKGGLESKINQGKDLVNSEASVVG